MNLKDNATMIELQSAICHSNNGELVPVANTVFVQNTVDSLDYFNVSLLKGYLSNNTVMRENVAVSNNTVVVY